MNVFILLLICWMIWKHQNEVVFNGLPTVNRADGLNHQIPGVLPNM